MTIVQSVEDVGPWRKQITIEIPAPEVEQEQQRVARDFGRQVSIPGFRKGKVPRAVIRQRFGSEIDKEVVERLLPRAWQEAQQETELEPLLAPQVEEVGEVIPGSPLTFVASIEVRPEVELGELDDFELPQMETEPTEDEIREAIDDLRRRVADWVPVERAAARGDMVTAEITEIPEKAPPEGEEPEPQTVEIEVGDPQVWEELSLAVTGLEPGQTGRFSHRDPAPQEGAAPPERHFRVEVVAVKERDLPELDDELASTVGDFESLEELESQVRLHIEGEKKQERREERHDALTRELRQRYPLELPRRVVDDEIQNLLQDYAQKLARQGVDVERADIDWETIGKQARPQAEERVHTRLLLDAVADHLDVQVEPGELEAALASLARAQGASLPAVKRALQENDRLAEFRTQVRRNKTVSRLMGEEALPTTDTPSDPEDGESDAADTEPAGAAKE